MIPNKKDKIKISDKVKLELTEMEKTLKETNNQTIQNNFVTNQQFQDMGNLSPTPYFQNLSLNPQSCFNQSGIYTLPGSNPNPYFTPTFHPNYGMQNYSQNPSFPIPFGSMFTILPSPYLYQNHQFSKKIFFS